jgi:hypothetical protein
MRPLNLTLLMLFSTAATAEGPELAVAVEEVLSQGVEATRIALPPASGGDEDLRAAVEAEVLRLLLERDNEEVITPAYIARVLDAAAASDAAAYGPLAADHVLLVSIVDAAGERGVELKLLHTESGGVVGQARAAWGEGGPSSVSSSTARGAVGRLVDQLFVSLSKLPGEHRYQRVAVSTLEARGEAAEGTRVHRFLRGELGRELADRGFLVVEREQLDAAIRQQELGALLNEESAPGVGKLVDAQAIVVGAVADAGEVFDVNLRVVGVESGAVLGAASTAMPRAGVVTLASGSVETRTVGEAIFRSVVAPGWGQFYNRRPVKGAAFATVGYGAAATTVALGAMSFLSVSAYDGYTPEASTPAAEVSLEAKALRENANAWLTATAVSGAITGSVWALSVADAMIDGMDQAP